MALDSFKGHSLDIGKDAEGLIEKTTQEERLQEAKNKMLDSQIRLQLKDNQKALFLYDTYTRAGYNPEKAYKQAIISINNIQNKMNAETQETKKR